MHLILSVLENFSVGGGGGGEGGRSRPMVERMLGEEVTPATRRYNMLRGGDTSYPKAEYTKEGRGWHQLPGGTTCYKEVHQLPGRTTCQEWVTPATRRVW